jgi:hypothetical protein
MLSNFVVWLRDSVKKILLVQVDRIGQISDKLLIGQEARQELLRLTQHRRKKLVFRSVL